MYKVGIVSSCEEPVMAEAPMWVNNLSYNHLLDTGSPYTSPEVTIIPTHKDTKVPVYAVFPPPPGTEDGMIPPPWSTHSNGSPGDGAPVTSVSMCHPGDKSDNYLVSNHTSPPPSHHVIIPTIQHHEVLHKNVSDSGELHKALRTLPGSASAPDLPKHWTHINSKGRLHSESLLEEAKLQEQLENRVQEWLCTHTEDDGGIVLNVFEHGTPEVLSDNDADDESDDKDDDDNALESSYL